MKVSVAIVLIVCGTVLIIVPYVHTSFGISKTADVMIQLSKTVNLKGDLPKFYPTVCMISGLAMIFTGASFSRQKKN